MLDVPSYDSEKTKPTCVVTLHQFMRYFKDEGGLANVDAVASEGNKYCLVISIYVNGMYLNKIRSFHFTC